MCGLQRSARSILGRAGAEGSKKESNFPQALQFTARSALLGSEHWGMRLDLLNQNAAAASEAVRVALTNDALACEVFSQGINGLACGVARLSSWCFDQRRPGAGHTVSIRKCKENRVLVERNSPLFATIRISSDYKCSPARIVTYTRLNPAHCSNAPPSQLITTQSVSTAIAQKALPWFCFSANCLSSSIGVQSSC